jgi:hypothetical protein
MGNKKSADNFLDSTVYDKQIAFKNLETEKA